MTITVEIGFSFKHEVGASELTLELPEGSGVLTALNELARLFSSIKERLFANSGEVHRHINALINGENVSFRKGFATVLRDGDRLAVLPPVGGS